MKITARRFLFGIFFQFTVRYWGKLTSFVDSNDHYLFYFFPFID